MLIPKYFLRKSNISLNIQPLYDQFFIIVALSPLVHKDPEGIGHSGDYFRRHSAVRPYCAMFTAKCSGPPRFVYWQLEAGLGDCAAKSIDDRCSTPAQMGQIWEIQ